MALLAVTENVKFSRLERALKIPRYQALGVLEALWHFTHRNAPRGDIGRYENEDIAAWIGWAGDADELINALVKTKWLDLSEKYRLVVHEWHIHASDATKLYMKRKNLTFVGFEQEEEGEKQEKKEVVESVVPTVSGQCGTNGDSVPTVSGLPVPVPVPEPEPDIKPPYPLSERGKFLLEQILSVPAFALSPPNPKTVEEIAKDFAYLNGRFDLEVKNAAEWARAPANRYAKNPEKPGSGAQFIRSWLTRNAKESPPPPSVKASRANKDLGGYQGD